MRRDVSLVAQVSKADVTGGGASRVADDLAAGLRSKGVDCERWMKYCRAGFDDKERFNLYREHPRLYSRIWTRLKRLGFPELLPLELGGLLKRDEEVHYDLFHFHDLSSAISPATVRLLARTRPVIWTFHDCSPFTAGCLYPMECEKFKRRCGACPQIGRWPLDTRFDFSGRLQDSKRRLHQEGNVVAVTPSAWMADMAVSSGLLSARPRVIPNGVDVDIFLPRDRDSAKSLLGIRRTRPVLLVAAHGLSDPRKGTQFAFEAIHAIKDLQPFVIAVGNMSDEIKRRLEGIDSICAGSLSEAMTLSFWYSMADLFVFCSLADNMPLSVLETMACGVPVVGFKTGGIPEMVEHDVTGLLVEPKDVNSLVSALRYAITGNRYISFGKESRRKAVAEYTLDRFIDAHITLYEEVVQKRNDQTRRRRRMG